MSQGLRARVLLTGGLAAMSVLAACTGSPHHAVQASATGSSIATPQLTTPAPPTSVPTYSQYPVPASVANDPAKQRQVKVDSCTASGTSAAAAGTIHNTGTRSASYDITVFFTSDTATAVDYATTSVTVGAGATANFTAQRTFAAPDKILCVLVGVS